MESNTKKRKTEKKYGRALFLLMIPVFFFSAYLVMGKRAKNDGYTKMGIFYGIASMLTFAVSALGLIWPALLYVLISHFIVWVLCVFHTFGCKQQYEDQAKWADEDKVRSPLTEDPSFRLRNSYWSFWNYIPLMGGFSTYYMGAKMGKAALKWIGAISTLVVAGLFFYLTSLEQVTNPVLTAISLVVAYTSICMHPLIAYCFFEDYLDVAAEQWTEDIEEYPQMENKSWRIKNSLWQVFTLVPSFGSLGVFWAGITRESGKTIGKACVLLALEMACLAVPSVIVSNEALLQAQPYMEGVAAGLNALGIFVYALVVFSGTMIRQDMLRIRGDQEMQF